MSRELHSSLQHRPGRPAIADPPIRSPSPRLAIPLELTLTAYLSAFITNLVSVTQRLAPIGQSDAVGILHGLEEPILAAAIRAAVSTIDDLGSATIMSEIASMRHETQPSRIFRT